ncbi:MAG TPA: hypothetical protein VMU33_00955 [Burkholderiaceae bacterium]|nr:hypothetical protein [Burkholderiaceae bacterium]
MRCPAAVHHAVTIGLLLACATATAADIPLQQRIAAVQATARDAVACVAAQPFYWEMGDATQSLASGAAGRDAPRRDTTMAIASASKWIYAAFVVEQRHGLLTDVDVAYLTFQSGYSRFRFCRPSQTVAACQQSPLNGFGRIDASTVGRFDYSGGHMQKHALSMGLGALDNDGLGQAIRGGLAPLGITWSFDYRQPQLAGGGATNAADYARFLRALMDGTLKLGGQLGTHAVCTNPSACPDQAVKTPIPSVENWHYSIGHWVEDDPQVGDGSFSSPGAFGFYPWISADKRTYGLVAREDHRGVLSTDEAQRPSIESVQCGRQMRAAWMDGVAKP